MLSKSTQLYAQPSYTHARTHKLTLAHKHTPTVTYTQIHKLILCNHKRKNMNNVKKHTHARTLTHTCTHTHTQIHMHATIHTRVATLTCT